MVLIIIFAVYSIFVGKIEVLPGWRFEGRIARWYGVALLFGAIPVSILSTLVMAIMLIPFRNFIAEDSVWPMFLGLVPTLVSIIAIAIPFRIFQGAGEKAA